MCLHRLVRAAFSWPKVMVDHTLEGACGSFSPKASSGALALASTDYLQEVDAALTPKMAPTTPMQVLQKPQQARESTNALPSFFLGSRAELKRASNMLHAVSHKPMPARSGLAAVSTSSKLHGRIQLDNQKEGSLEDENLLSFCLSKYEKRYQTPSTSLTEAAVAPCGYATHPGTRGLSTRVEGLPEVSPMHAQEPEKKLISTPTSATAVTYNVEVNDSSTLYSLAPGEVANNAYELYSKMFPSTCSATTECRPSTTDADVGFYLPSPFLEHMDNMQLHPPASYDQKPLVRHSCKRDDDPSESEKKVKYAKVKEEDTPGAYPYVKREPIFYEPWRTVDVGISSAAPSDVDTKPVQMPPESLSTVLCLPNSGKVTHSIDHPGGCGGHGSVETTHTQPAVGLKLFASSACMHLPKTLSNTTAREPSVPVPSEPYIGFASKTPAQGSSSTDADWGRYLALSAMPARSTEMTIMPFQQRFKELQAFLKQCDEGNQHECIQALRTLSAAARSGYAVELETRAIQLSLEEGKEMKRMRLLNVLGRISEGNLDPAGATPHGPRLPAPGAAPTPKHVL